MAEIMLDRSAGAVRVLLRGTAGDRVLPALWLRERSVDPAEVDAITGQRLIDPHALPEDLAVTGALHDRSTLRLSFSDGFSGDFDIHALLARADPGDGCPQSQPWRSDLAPVPLHRLSALARDATLHAAVTDFLRLGFILIEDTPVVPGSILQVAGRFGFVRETNFGRLFDVVSRPDSNDLAYRAVALGPHTDNPYRTPVPGIQILHCLINETQGGLSTLVDSLAVADVLRREDPEGFALLSRVPVRYRFRDADTELVAERPMIEVDGTGRMTGVHYSPRLDELPLMGEADTRRFQRTRRRFSELFCHPDFELRFRLEAGQLMMFDNNRILHGRTAYDPGEGRRHLQGCYIDRDGPRSLYRVLRRRLVDLASNEEAA